MNPLRLVVSGLVIFLVLTPCLGFASGCTCGAVINRCADDD